jgi:small subunit ribosomal protein S8
MTDPISDFLTRLRNAVRAKLPECSAPHSKMKAALAQILKEEGYILDYRVDSDRSGHKALVVRLKYVDAQPVIGNLRRLSTPGRRVYCGYREIPRVLNGMGVAIVSTSQGLLKDRDARRRKLGGELVCSVW